MESNTENDYIHQMGVLDRVKEKSTERLIYHFKPNRKFYAKLLTVRIEFSNRRHSYEEEEPLLSEWFHHHKYAFNYVWLQPEFSSNGRKLHYHGLFSIKDQFKFNIFLRKFSKVGQCHIEAPKNLSSYIDYCLKNRGITAACEGNYKDHLRYLISNHIGWSGNDSNFDGHVREEK